MGDVVSVEVDGELGPPPIDGDRRPPRMGMPIAVVLVVGLVGALGWSVARSGPSSEAQASTVTLPTTTIVPFTTTIVPTTTTSLVPTTTTVPVLDPVDAAQAALDAWGRFAGSGDLGELAGVFAPDGGQLEQLRAESSAIDDGEPYRVLLENASASDNGDGTMTVTGDVVWTRADESEQHYRWAIDLQPTSSGWLLVTVRTVA